jgi:hypothetical protein
MKYYKNNEVSGTHVVANVFLNKIWDEFIQSK